MMEIFDLFFSQTCRLTQADACIDQHENDELVADRAVAIGEYAPGRAIVVDKTTYQIGGLFYPSGTRSEQMAASPARAFMNDASYEMNIYTRDDD